MSNGITTALRVGAFTAVFLAGSAAASRASSPDAPPQSYPSTTAVSNHALSGVVKSVDATTLVVTRAGKSPGEITFVLGPSTHRDGVIGIGATVQVRFRTERDAYIATAVLATASKRHAATVKTP